MYPKLFWPPRNIQVGIDVVKKLEYQIIFVILMSFLTTDVHKPT